MHVVNSLPLDAIDMSDASLYQQDVWRPCFARLGAQGLVLTNVNTGLVIWSTEHDGNRFRIDEVRFVKDSS